MSGRFRKKPSWWPTFGDARVFWFAIVAFVLLFLAFLATGPVVNIHHITITR
jgi:hypothetical protein